MQFRLKHHSCKRECRRRSCLHHRCVNRTSGKYWPELSCDRLVLACLLWTAGPLCLSPPAGGSPNGCCPTRLELGRTGLGACLTRLQSIPGRGVAASSRRSLWNGPCTGGGPRRHGALELHIPCVRMLLHVQMAVSVLTTMRDILPMG